jgi:hypothetical protein
MNIGFIDILQLGQAGADRSCGAPSGIENKIPHNRQTLGRCSLYRSVLQFFGLMN